MFSGIIQAVVPIYSICDSINYKKYTVIFPQKLLKNLKIGNSVSNNGCCLTVISIKTNIIEFNLIHETLKSTNMNTLKIGDIVNIERSLNYNSEIGGHLMTGHIDCTGKIKKIIKSKKSITIWFKIKKKYLQKYIINKGSIGIEGVSLTVNKIIKDYIRVSLTTYTASNTNLSLKKIGDSVNIEVDLIIKTIMNNTEKNWMLLHEKFKYKNILYDSSTTENCNNFYYRELKNLLHKNTYITII